MKLDRETDTLGRWLAHYLAEKMECAASAPAGAEREADRRECVDLILRLWERRHAWPLSAPLKGIAERLDELLAPMPRFLYSTMRTSNPYLDLLHGLNELHHKETHICLAAWIVSLNLSKDREFLQNHSEHLDEDERRVIQRLVKIQDLMLRPEAHLGDEPCPNFATFSKAQQGKIVRGRLRAIGKSRTQLLGR